MIRNYPSRVLKLSISIETAHRGILSFLASNPPISPAYRPGPWIDEWAKGPKQRERKKNKDLPFDKMANKNGEKLTKQAKVGLGSANPCKDIVRNKITVTRVEESAILSGVALKELTSLQSKAPDMIR